MRRYFLFAHIDGLISSDPAVYARLPKVHPGEPCTQGLDRLELIRVLQRGDEPRRARLMVARHLESAGATFDTRRWHS